jgi:hypothetical protein
MAGHSGHGVIKLGSISSAVRGSLLRPRLGLADEVALRHQHFNLAKQRHDLLRAKPLLPHDQLLSKLIFSQRLV